MARAKQIHLYLSPEEWEALERRREEIERIVGVKPGISDTARGLIKDSLTKMGLFPPE